MNFRIAGMFTALSMSKFHDTRNELMKVLLVSFRFLIFVDFVNRIALILAGLRVIVLYLK